MARRGRPRLRAGPRRGAAAGAQTPAGSVRRGPDGRGRGRAPPPRPRRRDPRAREGDRPEGWGSLLTLAVFRLHQAAGDGVAQGHDLVGLQQAEQVTTALSLWAAEPRHLDPREGGRGRRQ